MITYAGWKETLEEAGIAISDDHVVEGDWSAKSGERCMEKLYRQYPEMDALFASNDLMALGAMKVARKLGVRIPEDLAIVGYDDISEADFFCPPLTTIRHDLMLSASFMVTELDHMIGAADLDDEDESVHLSGTHLFQPELIIRESSPKKKNGGDKEKAGQRRGMTNI